MPAGSFTPAVDQGDGIRGAMMACAAMLCVSFFLPWFGMMGTEVSGAQIVSGRFLFEWKEIGLIPILALSTLVAALLAPRTSSLGGLTGALTVGDLVVRALWFAQRTNADFADVMLRKMSRYGLWLTLLSAVLLFIVCLNVRKPEEQASVLPDRPPEPHPLAPPATNAAVPVHTGSRQAQAQRGLQQLSDIYAQIEALFMQAAGWIDRQVAALQQSINASRARPTGLAPAATHPRSAAPAAAAVPSRATFRETGAAAWGRVRRILTFTPFAGEHQGVRALLGPTMVLVTTLTYVFFELRYNRGLLDMFSRVDLDAKTVDALSNEGKVLAALGLTWAVLRVPIAHVRGILGQLVAFGVTSWLVYLGLTHGYDYYIRSLAPDTKVQGFHLAAYRKALLQEKVTDPEIPMPGRSPGTSGPIIMTSFPLVMFDDRYMSPARVILELKVRDYRNYYERQANQRIEAGWARYSARMNELQNAYYRYLNGSQQVAQVNPFFRQQAINRFRQKSGGMNPRPGATMDQFLLELRSAPGREGQRFRGAEADVVFIRNEGTPEASPVYGRDLPKFMDYQTFRARFWGEAQDRIAAEVDKVLPTTETVERAQGIHDINASVFLPPVAMVTSMLSILANVASAGWLLLTLPLLVLAKPSSLARRAASAVTPLVVLGAIATVLLLAPAQVFEKGTPMGNLESRMQQNVGAPGVVWSRVAAVQSVVYQRSSFIQRGELK